MPGYSTSTLLSAPGSFPPTTRRRRCGGTGWVLLASLLAVTVTMKAAANQQARFVDMGKDNRLVYESDPRGNRIPDFSHAGYQGGGIPLPDVPVRLTVAPVAGEDGTRIQAALDYVSQLPADTRGFRGAVLLGKGRFEIAGNLVLRTSGVVLRGQGSGADGTTLVATGDDRRPLIELHGKSERRTSEPTRKVTSEYVPVNARELELDSATGIKAGDTVLVRRPSPKNWLESLGMVSVPGRPAPTWVADKMDTLWERRVVRVAGQRVTLDAPLTCALEKEYGGGSLAISTDTGRIRQVGIENLRCESEWNHTNPRDEEHSWMAVTLENVEDAWVWGVTAAHFASSAVSIWESCSRITVEDCASLAPVSEIGGYRRHSFYTAGQQTLFLRCRAEEGRHDFAVGWLAPGPNAFVRCEAREAHSFSGAIESWATGALFDNVTMDGGGLQLDNRELWDNGVGWSAANSVVWQSTTPVIIARTPPGAQNWVIGCWAQFAGNANWRAPNEFVKPDSLYEAQLAERIGPEAAKAALQPRAIPISDTGAVSLDTILQSHPELIARPTPPPLPKVTTANGWLTVNGHLLSGGQPEVTWWRGHTQPNRALDFGFNPTRFVPGRFGPGLTDNLPALTDRLLANGSAGVRHHWGLWYDRRRDDHEMFRRPDSEVWPPFYEQPWARSGTGRAWDGLSRYDVTRFNSWYFRRLREFAQASGQKGLLLVDAMYFQHNILEAGAHWADFPWRPANCLQETGFPEPPPYEGKKRVFMAEAFYDVTHPVRRELHRAYIRHCLDNLADQPNVIHILGEEFTGPLHFVQFWLDTVAEWRQETGKKILIGLSATKDVQDAILADPKRSLQVDVIDFKYWWTAKGKEFAPRGGQNLAPRQFEREWKGGRPEDVDLAQMASEYRGRYPGKAILCDFASAGWAFVCAGGSVPNLPRTTQANLLQSLPEMQPWKDATNNGQWVLRSPGKHYLIYIGRGASGTLDLTGESGNYRVQLIQPETGVAVPTGERVIAGRPITLRKPSEAPAILWLTREPSGEVTP